MKKNSSIVEKKINNEVVLFDVYTGEFYGLQDTSLYIWEILDKCKNINDIVDHIKLDYEFDDQEDLYIAVKEILLELKKERLIEYDESH